MHGLVKNYEEPGSSSRSSRPKVWAQSASIDAINYSLYLNINQLDAL